ncbi:MAG TPA: nucleoside-triphosphatase [Bacillota bacterium]|nr:nucleoside-triphosphatase [Bacillota bacterium]HPJ86016.1 nucleoside-triphosphatase [Bacillota bacterium]
MVSIVTGKINSGKTGRMISIYEKTHKGDGFVSLKNMDGNTVLGYDAMQLSTGEKFPLVSRKGRNSVKFRQACRIGPYFFSQDAIDMIGEKIGEMIKNNVSPLYLDEIGPLEIEGKVFDNTLKAMISSGLDICITVRTGLLEKVIERYDIGEYRIV